MGLIRSVVKGRSESEGRPSADFPNLISSQSLPPASFRIDDQAKSFDTSLVLRTINNKITCKDKTTKIHGYR